MIEQQLADEVKHYKYAARANYVVLYFLYAIAVAASILSTLFAATGVRGAYLAVLTAIPGASLLINNLFKFSERSQWHYEKKRRLTALLRLRQGNAEATSDAQVAEKWNRIDEEMDKLWPGWGTLPTTPHKLSNSP